MSMDTIDDSYCEIARKFCGKDITCKTCHNYLDKCLWDASEEFISILEAYGQGNPARSKRIPCPKCGAKDLWLELTDEGISCRHCSWGSTLQKVMDKVKNDRSLR
ncbi:MAG: hypothetical protein WC479_05930 [Candidatus Izemoplasmatales bacterium]